ICVVEEPKDIEAIERTREFRGLYHVLGGALDPINGIGPNELRIAGLMRRVGEEFEGEEIAEIIIATDPNTTGEATSTYLARLLRPFPELVVSRLASGLPMGADLEFADELTLGSALSGRRILSGGPSQPARSGGVLRPEQSEPRAPQPFPEPSPEPAEQRMPGPDSGAAGRTGLSEVEEPRGVPVPHRP
ncbi:MAG: recombination protein RecR, partial [Dietzia sp.]|nr:recombination protein RecR [Dietzia sp.]